MANSFNVQGTASLSTTKAEKDLSRFINKAERRKVRLALDDKAFTQPLGRITGAADEFNKSLAASNARVVAFAASAGLMFAVQRALGEVAKSAIEVEKSLADVNVILGATTSNLHKFGRELFNIAGQTGQAFGVVSEAATELARQGLSLEETLKRTRDAMILTRLSGMDAASSVNALTAAMNTFKNTALDTTKIVNKMANVDAAFAVSTTDLAEALKRVGSSALDAGVNFDQLLAMVTAVQQTTARGGPVIGNALKSIFTRIQRTGTLDQLESLGFTVRSLDGQTRPAIAIMTELAKKIDILTAAQKVFITELIGGVFQINVVKAALADLGSEYSIYNNALATSVDSTNQAIARNEELNKTLSALVNKTFANVKKAAADIGKLTIAPALGGVLEKVNDMLENFDTGKPEGAGEKIAAGILDGIGKFVKGPGLVIGLAIIGKLLQNFGRFASDSFKEFFNINEAAKKRVELEKFVNAELMKNEDLTQAILKGELSVADAEKIILANLKNRVREQEKLLSIVKQTSSLLRGSGVNVVGTDAGGGDTNYAIRPPKGKSGGHIPNYSSGNLQDLVREELKGASYATGGTKAVVDTLPGLGLHVRNNKEQVKGSPYGPFINPPMNSPEGYRHRSEAIKRTGLDPYTLSAGHVPNFAKKRGSKSKIANLGLAAPNTGMLLPMSGNNKLNQTYDVAVSKLGLSGKRKKNLKESYPEANRVKMGGFNEAKLRRKGGGSLDFDKFLDKVMDGVMPQIGRGLMGGKGRLKTKTGTFSSFFDKTGWPQVRGRIFEGALNFVQDSTKSLTGESVRGTWDFKNIEDYLADLYKIEPGGLWDAKNSNSADSKGSMINKSLKESGMFSGGFIPNFAASPANMRMIKTALEAEIQKVASGVIEVNKTQGLASRISSSNLPTAEKENLKGKLNAAKDKQKAKKRPGGVTIDGRNLGSMLVPKVGRSGGAGLAKPEAADNDILKKYLSKHYENKTGVKWSALDEAQRQKVMGATRASFPVLGPIKGGKTNIVGDVGTAIEKETQSFISSMIGSGGDPSLVQKNLKTHASSVSSAAGAVFESGIKTAFDLDVGKTNDRFDSVTTAGLKQAFPISTPYGEFKIEDSSPLRQNMASKILKEKIQAGIANAGHIPNFADPNRVREALQAGVPYDRTYSSYVDTSKYEGPVVGNRRDEPTRQALKRAVMMHNDPENAGKFSSGWVPNFATPDESTFKQTTAAFEKELAEAEGSLDGLGKEADEYIEQLKGSIKESKELEAIFEKLGKTTKERIQAEKDQRTAAPSRDDPTQTGVDARQQRLDEKVENISVDRDQTPFTKGGAGSEFSASEKKRLMTGEDPAKIAQERSERGRATFKHSQHGGKPTDHQLKLEQEKQLALTKAMNQKLKGAQQTQEKINADRIKVRNTAEKNKQAEARVLELKKKEAAVLEKTVLKRQKVEKMAGVVSSQGAGMRQSIGAGAGRTAAESPLMTMLPGSAAHRDQGILKAVAAGKRTMPGMSAKMAQGKLDEVSQARGARMQSAGMTASFVAPMLTSTLAQAGAMSQGASNFTGQMAMGAGMGAQFGPWGALAGGVVGGGLGAPALVDSMNSELAEFTKTAEIAKDKLNKLNAGTQNYIKNLTDFNEALLDTSGKFSPEDLIERQDKLQESLMAIPDEFLSRFSAAQGNVKEIQKIFAEIRNDLQKEAQQTESAKGMTAMFEKESGGWEWGDNIFTNDKKEGELLQKEYMSMVEGTLDMSKLTGAAGKANAEDLKKAAKNLKTNSEGFFTVLKRLGMGPGAEKAIRRMYSGNAENLELLMDDFEELADKAQNTSTAVKKMSVAQIEYANHVSTTTALQDNLNSIMRESQEMIITLSNTLAERFKFVNKFADTKRRNKTALDLNNLSGQVRVNAPFSDPTVQNKNRELVASEKLAEKQRKAFEGIQTGARNALIGGLGNELKRLSKAISTAGTGKSADALSNEPAHRDRLEQQEKISGILKNALGMAKAGGTPKDIADEIKKEIDASGLNEAVQVKLREDVVSTLEKNDQSLANLYEQNEHEKKLLEANNKFQQQIVDNTRMLSEFGGIQDFLKGGHSGLKKVNDVFDYRQRVDRPGQTRGEGMIGGSVAAGRSDLQVLDLLRNFAKFDPDSFPKALREGAVSALTAHNVEIINAMRSGLAGGGELGSAQSEALDFAEANASKTAELQVENLLKDRNPVVAAVQGVESALGALATKQDQAFRVALTNTFGGGANYLSDPLNRIDATLADQKSIREVQDLNTKVADLKAQERAIIGEDSAKFGAAQTATASVAGQFSETLLRDLGILNSKEVTALEYSTTSIYKLSDSMARLETLLDEGGNLSKNYPGAHAPMMADAEKGLGKFVSTLLNDYIKKVGGGTARSVGPQGDKDPFLANLRGDFRGMTAQYLESRGGDFRKSGVDEASDSGKASAKAMAGRIFDDIHVAIREATKSGKEIDLADIIRESFKRQRGRSKHGFDQGPVVGEGGFISEDEIHDMVKFVARAFSNTIEKDLNPTQFSERFGKLPGQKDTMAKTRTALVTAFQKQQAAINAITTKRQAAEAKLSASTSNLTATFSKASLELQVGAYQTETKGLQREKKKIMMGELGPGTKANWTEANIDNYVSAAGSANARTANKAGGRKPFSGIGLDENSRQKLTNLDDRLLNSEKRLLDANTALTAARVKLAAATAAAAAKVAPPPSTPTVSPTTGLPTTAAKAAKAAAAQKRKIQGMSYNMVTAGHGLALSPPTGPLIQQELEKRNAGEGAYNAEKMKGVKENFGQFAGDFFEMDSSGESRYKNTYRDKVLESGKGTEDFYGLKGNMKSEFNTPLNTKGIKDQFGVIGSGEANKRSEGVIRDVKAARDKARRQFLDGKISKNQKKALANAEPYISAISKESKGEISKAELSQAIQQRIQQLESTGNLETGELFTDYLMAKAGFNEKDRFNEKDTRDLKRKIADSLSTGTKDTVKELEAKIDKTVEGLTGKGLTKDQVNALATSLSEYGVAEKNFADGMSSRALLISSAQKAFNDAVAANENTGTIKTARQQLIDSLSKTQTGGERQQKGVELAQRASATAGMDRFTPTPKGKKSKFNKFADDVQKIVDKYQSIADGGLMSQQQADAISTAQSDIAALDQALITNTEDYYKAYEKLYAASLNSSEQKAAFDKLIEAQNKYFNDLKTTTKMIEESYKNLGSSLGSRRGTAESFSLEVQGKINSIEEGGRVNLSQQEKQNIANQVGTKRDIEGRFAEGRVNSNELIAARDQALQDARKNGEDTGEAFLDSLAARFSYGSGEFDAAIENMSLSLIDSFESNLNDAMFNAVTGAKDVEEAFGDMADAMLDEMTKMAIQATTRSIIGSLGIPGLEGRNPEQMASGGLVTGGSGH